MLPVHCQARRQLAASSQSLDLCAVQQHGLWGMGESGTRALQDQYESAALVVDVGVRGRLVGGSSPCFVLMTYGSSNTQVFCLGCMCCTADALGLCTTLCSLLISLFVPFLFCGHPWMQGGILSYMHEVFLRFQSRLSVGV